MRQCILVATVAVAAAFTISTQATEDIKNYSEFRELPITAIKPQGWIKIWLQNQAEGLTGNPSELGYPYDQPLWTKPYPQHPIISSMAKDWWPYEQTAYQVDGMVRAGYLLNDKKLLSVGLAGVNHVINTPMDEKGTLFPGPSIDSWPTAVFMRSVMAYYSATQDKKVLEVLTRHYKENPGVLTSSGRSMVNLEIIIWLYFQTGDKELLEIATELYNERFLKSNGMFGIKHMLSDEFSYSHGVVYMERAKLPAIVYMATGDKNYLNASLNEFRKLERDHMLPDGMPTCDEHISGRVIALAHETCDISDYSWSMGYLLMATGDSHWSDNIEKAIFNALPGAVTKDFKALQYFSTPNQVRSTTEVSYRNRMCYRPGFITQCCSGNVSRAMPNYVSRMWMKNRSGGLVATLYGPSQVTAKVGSGKHSVTITETTDYPFSDTIIFNIKSSDSIQFPLTLRIPEWCKAPSIKINNKEFGFDKIVNGFVTINRKFSDKDSIKLVLPRKLIAKNWTNEKYLTGEKKYDDMKLKAKKEEFILGGDGIWFEYGPLVMSLKIKEKHTINNSPLKVRLTPKGGGEAVIKQMTISSDEFPAWDITAESSWNYGINNKNTTVKSAIITHKAMPSNPWISATTPLEIKIPAYLITNWRQNINVWENQHRQPPLPKDPQPTAKKEIITLIPLGATHLRVTVFSKTELKKSIDGKNSSELPKVPKVSGASADKERGSHFSKKIYTPKELPTFADNKDKLPVPVIENNPGYLEMYWKCWDLAFNHLKKPVPENGFVSNYLDEGYNKNIFQWDTIFMVMFSRYAHQIFPAIQSLDNFYCKQHYNGFICREIWETNGHDHHGENSPQAINPPLFSWAEVESFRVTGDKSRFAMVVPVLEKYVEWLETGRKKKTVHNLYWSNGLGSGMDNSPRHGSGWTDMSAQMVMQYNDLAAMCKVLGQNDKALKFQKRANEIGDLINRWMWNEEDGLYYDLNDKGEQIKWKTVACFWPMLAGITSQEQEKRLIKNLHDPKSFWRKNVFPSLAADQKHYSSTGAYWRGGVWAPTNYAIIRGLAKSGHREFATLATTRYLDEMYKVFKNTKTVWELYAPDKEMPGIHYGEKLCKPDFVGWTGCGPIAMLIENIIGIEPNGAKKEISWYIQRTDTHGIKNLQFGNMKVSLICKSRKTKDSPCDIDVTTDQEFTLNIFQGDSKKTYKFKAGTHEIRQ